MKILALDSSGLTASVALLEDEQMLGEYTLNRRLTHSKTLFPMMQELFDRLEEKKSELDAIAVSKGPGSFTGLRIGAAAAKGLGLALQIPLIPVPTTAALAYQLYGAQGVIVPIMDARRNQVYTGFYRFQSGVFQTEKEQCAQRIEDTAKQLKEYKEKILFVGDGVPVYENVIKEILGEQALFVPEGMNRQRAGAVGALAIQYYRKGFSIDADEFRPEYLRKPQAERERDEKEKKKI